MRIWMITNLRAAPAKPLKASAIQNIQTAAALARRGHRVLLWTDNLQDPDARRCIGDLLGIEAPEGLRCIAARGAHRPGEKRSPFANAPQRIANLVRGTLAAGLPDIVLSRSPRILSQWADSRLLPARAIRLLEYQYPEWALLWRGWRRKHAQAPLSQCVTVLRELRRKEEDWTRRAAHGILYAARGHEPLIATMRFQGPAQWLPSACPEPDESPPPMPEFDLGYVGAIAPENGVDTLLEALAKMPEKRLLVVGNTDGAYGAGRVERARGLGLGDRVRFAGHLPHGQIRTAMRRCRLGVVPLSARHGPEKRQWASPLKLVEWMSAGVPVLAAAVPSVAQHVAADRTAALCPPDASEALARSAGELLDSPGSLASLRERGLRMARGSTYNCRAERIEAFCHRLLGRQGASL